MALQVLHLVLSLSVRHTLYCEQTTDTDGLIWRTDRVRNAINGRGRKRASRISWVYLEAKMIFISIFKVKRHHLFSITKTSLYKLPSYITL